MEIKMSKILDYFRYPSTWNSLIGLISVFGVVLNPEQVQGIATAGVALVSAVSLFFSDSDIEKK
jgi:hypothetical protein